LTVKTSPKNNYPFGLPFLSLARQLADDPNLQFTTAVVLAPPEVDLDPSLAAQYEAELAQAESVPLPQDDTDFIA
jgi:GTP-binding nuclear protein Ran